MFISETFFIKEKSYFIKSLSQEDKNSLYELEQIFFDHAWTMEQLSTALESNQYFFYGIFCSESHKLISYITLQYISDTPQLSKYESKGGEFEILNIATHTDFQGKGFAEKLLTFCINFAKEKDANLFFLDVREFNTPAKNLYIKLGFQVISTRKNYYSTNKGKENALIMQLQL